jgi:hypothetical protein
LDSEVINIQAISTHPYNDQVHGAIMGNGSQEKRRENQVESCGFAGNDQGNMQTTFVTSDKFKTTIVTTVA